MTSINDVAKFFGFALHTSYIPQSIPRAVIPYLELTYLIDGEMTYFLDDEKIQLSPQDAIIIPKGHVRYRPPQQSRATYASFNIITADDFDPRLSGLIKNAIRSDTTLMLESAAKSSRSISHNKYERVISIFFYLYYQLLDHTLDRENTHVRAVKSFIRDKLCEPVTLDEIAAEVHLVPQYLCSLFKKETSMTITEYLTRERIDLAKRLILMNADSLTKISADCGFSDYNYFSRTFKRLVGITASEYKKTYLT